MIISPRAIIELATIPLMLAAFIPYTRGIIKREVKPVSSGWFAWSAILWISFFAQKETGATSTLITALVDMIGVTFIFALSLFYGIKKIYKLDIFCVAISLASILIWVYTKNPITAIYLNIIADIAASVPIYKHAYCKPHEEEGWLFVLFSIGAMINILISTQFTFDILVFPVYIFLLNASLGILIIYRQRTQTKL